MGVPVKAGVDDLPRNWGNGRTKERRGGCDVNATRDGPRGDLSGLRVCRRGRLPAGEFTQGGSPARARALNQARKSSRPPNVNPPETNLRIPLRSPPGEAPVDEVLAPPAAWEAASEGGTGFQPGICGSHSRDGGANLRTEGIGNLGSCPAQGRAVMGAAATSYLPWRAWRAAQRAGWTPTPPWPPSAACASPNPPQSETSRGRDCPKPR
jgi:hypothetical protein